MARKAGKKKKKVVAKTKKKTARKAVKKVKKKAKRKTKSKRKAKSTRKSQKVSAMPKGYNNITPYLILGNAAKAIDFYKKIFGAKEVMRLEQPDGRVGHAELKIGDTKIMLADEYPEMDARGPQAYGGSPIHIHLYVKNVDDTIDRAVAQGAKVARPVANMFYGDRSGTIIDPYGHKWYVSTHVENVSNAELKKRAAAMFNKS